VRKYSSLALVTLDCIKEPGFISSFVPAASSGVSGELSDLCKRSTEFHFPELETQLETAQADLKKLGMWRTDFWKKKQAAEARLGGDVSAMEAPGPGLQAGDFFLTRHSNLCETHVIFHMVGNQFYCFHIYSFCS
jgi:Uncharacterized conserved protein (DUF2362).